MSFSKVKFKVLVKKIFWLSMLCLLAAAVFLFEHNNSGKSRSQYSAQELSDKTSRISKLNISLDQRDYDFLFSDLPLSLRTYQKGILLADNQPKVYNIDFRLRGNHAWHWYKEKPSFRIRTSEKNRIYSRKELDLINPEDPSGFSNVLSEIMAAKIGLPHIDMSFCQVHINNEYKGLYIISDSASSENIQSADGVKGPVVNGNDWNLSIWLNEKLWEYEKEIVGVSQNLELQTELEQKMKSFIQCLKDPLDLVSQKDIKNHLDIEKTAQWSAFMTIIGSVHTDDFHNNFFAYDKTKKVYFPLIIDPSGFGILTSISNKNSSASIELSIYEFLTPVFNFLFRNPEFQYKRNSYIYNYLTKTLTKEYVNNTVNEWRKKIEPLYYLEKEAAALITVPELLFPIRLPVSPEFRIKDIDRLLEYYNSRYDFLLKELESCDVVIYPCQSDQNIHYKEYAVFVKGNSPVKWNLSAHYPKVYLDKDLSGNITENERIAQSEILLYPALKKCYPNQLNLKIEEEIRLMLDKRLARYMLQPEYQSYLIAVDSQREKQILDELEHNAQNAVTASKVKVAINKQVVDKSLLYVSHDSIHPWSLYEQN